MKTTMKCLLFASFLFLVYDLPAQHCPFDGYYTLAIRTGKTPEGGPMPAFYLVEKEGSGNDSCRFDKRVDSLRFQTEQEVRANMDADPNSTRSRYMPDWLKRDHNFLKGNRVVFLTMSQKDCMVPRGNEYEMRARHLVVRFSYNGSIKELPVPAESIYSLCGTGGSWKRIQPLEIDLSAEK